MNALALQTYTDDLPTSTPSFTGGASFATSRILNGTAKRILDSQTGSYEKILAVALSAARSAIAQSGLREPLVSWTADIEPSLSTSYFGLNSYSLSEEHTELTDQDIPLPSYCVRASLAFEHYSSLQDGWDGEEASAPTAQVLQDANYLLRILGSNIPDLPEARPMLDADGIPGIFWSNSDQYLSISFYGEFSLTYFYKDLQTSQAEARTISMNSGEDIARLLLIIEDIQS